MSAPKLNLLDAPDRRADRYVQVAILPPSMLASIKSAYVPASRGFSAHIYLVLQNVVVNLLEASPCLDRLAARFALADFLFLATI